MLPFQFLAAFALTGAAPPPPAVYDVEIVYQITAVGQERVSQYFAMTKALKKIGFERAAEPPPEDTEPEDTRDLPFHGTIAAAKARKLLDERHVRLIRLMPKGTKLPADKDALVRVHLELPASLGPARQLLLTEQLRAVLGKIGFKEGAVYDHHGFTRLVGALPVGQIDTVLKDLRKNPEGAKQEPPFTSGPPIRVLEILPDMPQLASWKAPTAPTGDLAKISPDDLAKISPELLELVNVREKATEPLRYEAILALTPEPGSLDWIRPLRATVFGATIEGRVGPLLTIHGSRGQVLALAKRREIVALRLPRAPRPLFPVVDGKLVEPVSLTTDGVVQQRLRAAAPQGIRAAVVDGDFRDWEKLRKAFPDAKLRIIDMTRERNRDLAVEPYPFTGPRPGQGTRFARTLLNASPQADLTLICVDPAAPYQIETIARAIHGDRPHTLALDQRERDLALRRDDLASRSSQLRAERQRVFEDFRVGGEAEANRKTYRKKQADHDCAAAAFALAQSRYVHLLSDLNSLKGIRLVLCGLVWDDGQPLEGGGALSRYFDDRAFNASTWFQYAGDAKGQAWTGPFQDHDHNGVMEFAPPSAALLPKHWTRELNFMAWRPFKGEQTAEVPANALLRVSLQWREAHEPDLLRTGEDPYRKPLSDLRLSLLHQVDPTGTKQPDDDMEIVAESIGPAERLQKTANEGVYEQTILFRVPKAGRYAVRILGRAATDTRPSSVPSVPANRRTFELKPRLFVATLDGDGRTVLADYSTEAGALGTPTDANRVQRVGP